MVCGSPGLGRGFFVAYFNKRLPYYRVRSIERI
nr:MAG TPA: Phosphomevalonate kinase [Caudoviricetes sp.]